MRMKWWIVTALAIILISVAVFIFIRLDNAQGNAPIDETDSVFLHSLEQFNLDEQPVKGDRQAPLQIVEIGDYKCSSCRK